MYTIVCNIVDTRVCARSIEKKEVKILKGRRWKKLQGNSSCVRWTWYYDKDDDDENNTTVNFFSTAKFIVTTGWCRIHEFVSCLFKDVLAMSPVPFQPGARGVPKLNKH